MTRAKTFQSESMADLENAINKFLATEVGVAVSITTNGIFYVAIVLYEL
jgi:putative flippase GtrA